MEHTVNLTLSGPYVAQANSLSTAQGNALPSTVVHCRATVSQLQHVYTPPQVFGPVRFLTSLQSFHVSGKVFASGGEAMPLIWNLSHLNSKGADLASNIFQTYITTV